MNDDLRTRINAVLAVHYPQTTGYQDVMYFVQLSPEGGSAVNCPVLNDEHDWILRSFCFWAGCWVMSCRKGFWND